MYVVVTIRKIKIRRMRLGGTCSAHGQMRNAYSILVGKTQVEDLVAEGRILFEWVVDM
jgi:hypothetical protein